MNPSKTIGLIHFTLSYNHRDRGKHIERACQLHGAKTTRHGLLHKGFNISLLNLMDMNRGLFCLFKNNLT